MHRNGSDLTTANVLLLYRQRKLAVCAAHGNSHADTAHMSRRAATLATAGALLLATGRRASAEEQDDLPVTQDDLIITDVVRLILQV